MSSPKVIIVGGRPDVGEASGVVTKISREFIGEGAFVREVNGPNTGLLGLGDVSEADLTVWMPEIPNHAEKQYPKKRKGSVLICSKFIHGDRTRADAVSRIFRMHGNAVICIYENEDSATVQKYKFELIDALGNTWVEKTPGINNLVRGIMKLYSWSQGQERMSVPKMHTVEPAFLEVIHRLSDKVQNQAGTRFFGNASTRCAALFPSCRTGLGAKEQFYLFSARNTDKRHIRQEDFVLIKRHLVTGDCHNMDQRKPSVDTPVQLAVYERLTSIDYMIHGHACIDLGHTPTTENYFPCGDLRELKALESHFNPIGRATFAINLKNHGFLIGADNITRLAEMVRQAIIKPLNDLS